LLSLFAVLLIPTGIHYWHTYQQAIVTCTNYPASGGCGDLSSSLFTSRIDGLIKIAVVLGTFALPVLFGIFVGSSLLSKEYEEGTNKLVWTQGVSRRKWLTVKLVWVLAFALLYGLALALLATWWSRTLNTLAHYRFVQGHFETQGLMPVAYSLFFTAFGIMAGAWFRRTLLAMAITFGAFVLCMTSFAQWIRPHYQHPVTVVSVLGPNEIEGEVPTDAWVLNRGITDKNGKMFDSFRPDNMPAQCRELTRNMQVADGSRVARLKASGQDPVDDCLNTAGYRQTATYQPSYRYWNFQRIEAGAYLGMAAITIAVTYWLVIKRDA
jgi:hypothetical protein